MRGMSAALSALAFLALPLGIVWLTDRWAPLRMLGPILACYAGGLALGLTGWGAEAEGRVPVMEGSLALALPLLLFSVDMRSWGRVAGRGLLAMGLAVLAAFVLAVGLFFAFRGSLAAPGELSAMAVAMYSGGVANLGAVKLALGIEDARFLSFALIDTGVGALYLLAVLTWGAPLARRLLGEPQPMPRTNPDPGPLPDRRFGPDLIVALLAAALCVGAALALAPVTPGLPKEAAAIVLITAFGLAASLLPPLRRNIAAPRAGILLIYVFSFCVAAGLDPLAFAGVDPRMILFVLLATFGSLALHGLLCRLLRIDGETFLVTSVAAIMSPAFVPLVAPRLREPALLVTGMTMGVLGFALGSYLGIATGLALEGLSR